MRQQFSACVLLTLMALDGAATLAGAATTTTTDKYGKGWTCSTESWTSGLCAFADDGTKKINDPPKPATGFLEWAATFVKDAIKAVVKTTAKKVMAAADRVTPKFKEYLLETIKKAFTEVAMIVPLPAFTIDLKKHTKDISQLYNFIGEKSMLTLSNMKMKYFKAPTISDLAYDTAAKTLKLEVTGVNIDMTNDFTTTIKSNFGRVEHYCKDCQGVSNFKANGIKLLVEAKFLLVDTVEDTKIAAAKVVDSEDGSKLQFQDPPKAIVPIPGAFDDTLAKDVANPENAFNKKIVLVPTANCKRDNSIGTSHFTILKVVDESWLRQALISIVYYGNAYGRVEVSRQASELILGVVGCSGFVGVVNAMLAALPENITLYMAWMLSLI